MERSGGRIKLAGCRRGADRVACRTLVRQRGYSFINVGGLAVGLTVATLIGLWMHDELLAGLLTLAVTLLTVSCQTVKAARMHAVKSLRSE